MVLYILVILLHLSYIELNSFWPYLKRLNNMYRFLKYFQIFLNALNERKFCSLYAPDITNISSITKINGPF